MNVFTTCAPPTPHIRAASTLQLGGSGPDNEESLQKQNLQRSNACRHKQICRLEIRTCDAVSRGFALQRAGGRVATVHFNCIDSQWQQLGKAEDLFVHLSFHFSLQLRDFPEMLASQFRKCGSLKCDSSSGDMTLSN